MQRKINFNAGPAALPQEVLQQAAEAVLEYDNTGLSVLELPHRGKHFEAILEESKQLVKELCGLGNDYQVLWLPGGGRLQFAMIPINFLSPERSAGYIDSGHWATEAMQYAMHYGDVQVLASSAGVSYTRLPGWPEIPSQLSYVHVTTNNTIYGTQWRHIPDIKNIPLIADMSSDIFSHRADYSRCSMFYATAQKNIGPAGVALVAIHNDMLQMITNELPPMLDYRQQAAKNSVLNTPPVYAIYVSLLMLRWTKNKGLDIIEKENILKARMLYDEIERNLLFEPVVKHKEDRSIMNVCFTAKNKSDEKTFSEFCVQNNITGIEGHRTVGGFRASLYNSVSVTDADALVQAMQAFEKMICKG